MFFPSCLLAVAIFGTASAQTFSIGNCNADMETVNNFDIVKFSGKWYEIKRSYNSPENATKCYIGHFNLHNKHVYLAEHTFVAKKLGSQRQTVTYKHRAQDLKNGKLLFEPGFLTDEQSFWILDTDYKTFGIAYSCVDSHQGKFEYVWTMARTPTMDKALIEKVEKTLKARNINVELITEDQDCD